MAADQEVVGNLTAQSAFDVDQTQAQTWLGSLGTLRKTLAPFGRGHLFLEFDIPPLGRRVDAVAVIDQVVFVIEFKVGAKTFLPADIVLLTSGSVLYR